MYTLGCMSSSTAFPKEFGLSSKSFRRSYMGSRQSITMLLWREPRCLVINGSGRSFKNFNFRSPHPWCAALCAQGCPDEAQHREAAQKVGGWPLHRDWAVYGPRQLQVRTDYKMCQDGNSRCFLFSGLTLIISNKWAMATLDSKFNIVVRGYMGMVHSGPTLASLLWH